MTTRQSTYRYTQTGQTLIETLVALFIVTIGIFSSLGLATFALSSTQNMVKQMVGNGLAREGMEAVKNMRDTNWLRASIDSNCYSYATGASDMTCYKNWLSNPYQIVQGSATEYTLDIKDNDLGLGSSYWVLKPYTSGGTFQLSLDANSSQKHLYSVSSPSGSVNSAYYRKIELQLATTSDTWDGTSSKILTNQGGVYDKADYYKKLKVSSKVWWDGPGCGNTATYDTTSTKCKIWLQEYLTNWKTF